ncbi:unnamed protein product [Peronospora belbahrii]|uniref:Rad60/SUMO-like domain-containing protein n=1 Tax=Peronospora belbahrii TaxID=622444 RepID=A0AAU9L8E8_9STRA|nr:unnamed protein product [Peronospora belbahrii]CAH0517072.1 unnamed protein product [Peronospora belbahrii]
MSSNEEEDVKLYSALDRNKKRKMMVSLSSSSGEDTDDKDRLDDVKILETPEKRKRHKTLLKDTVTNENIQIILDSSDEDDDLYTPGEKQAERLRKQQLEREIRQKLEKDKVLNQTRAILSKVSSTKRKTNEKNLEIILLDSDSADDNDGDAPVEPVALLPLQSVVDKGARILLHVRSNGGAVDEVAMYKKETFDQLYVRFCELHGLPQSAVNMMLDGEVLSLKATPDSEDLDSGDLIEAKVDFSKQIESKKKTYLRLRLVMFGKRSEIFKIDAAATVEKLHTSYCKRHDIANPADVVMSVQDQELRLNEHLGFYGLTDHDEIFVKRGNSAGLPHTATTIRGNDIDNIESFQAY